MALSIAKEDADHPLSIVDTDPPLASDLKKSFAQSRQQPAPRAQAKLADIDTSFYDLDLNSDPLQPSDSQVNNVSTTDRVIALPPQLHFNEHHQHHRHRHEAMTIGDMSEPHLTNSVEDAKPYDTSKNGKKDHKIISSTFTESPMMIDPAELMSQGGVHGKGATKPTETVIDVAESSGTPTTPSATTAVNAGNYPSYSASFFRGWFDLPPSLLGQSPTQRPRLSLSMQGTAPAPLLPTSSSLSPKTPKTPKTVDIPLAPMRPVKRNEVYGSGHQESFSLGEDEEDTSAWGMGASSNTERESRRGQMAQ